LSGLHKLKVSEIDCDGKAKLTKSRRIAKSFGQKAESRKQSPKE